MLQSANSKLLFCLAIVGYSVFCTLGAATARPPSVLSPRQQAAVIAEGAENSSSWEFPSDNKNKNMTEFVATDNMLDAEADIYSKTYDEPIAAPMPEGADDEESSWSFFTPDYSNQCNSSCRDCSNHGVFGNLVGKNHGHWVARFDSIILWRNAPTDRTIFNFDVPADTTALNADQLESDVLAAPRLSLFHINQCGYGIEATYIYAGNFYSERGPFANTTQNNIFKNPPVGGTPYNTSQAKLLGQFQSFELNGRTPMGVGNVQFISGFRWLQWKEWTEVTGTGGGAGATFTDTFTTECFNDLYGGQIGFDALLYQSPGGFRLESVIKAGAYYNAAVQGSTATITSAALNNTESVRVSGIPAGGAFMGELSLTGVIPIHNRWDFRFGYTGFWLESLAQPINQFSGQTLDKNNPGSAVIGSLTTTGRLVLQGLSLGLEGRW